jgi:hypothetical protein
MFNPDDYSLIMIVVGVRGSGKSILLTLLQEYQLRHAARIMLLRKLKNKPNLYARAKVNVWANYPLKYYLKPQQLNVDRLITWKEEYRNGWIFYDDIGEFLDKQDWQNPAAKLINKGVQVMRHRNISLAGSMNFIEDLNGRSFRQTDIIIKVRDLCRTPWGIANGLKPGEVANSLWIDKSGTLTGYAYDENKRYYQMRFFGKKIWNDFNSFQDYDVMEMGTKYEVEKRVKKLDANGDVIETNHDTVNDALVQDIIHNTILFYQHNQPGERIPSKEFWDKAREMGLNNGINISQKWGGYLSDIGVKRRVYTGVNRYDFEEVQVV